MSFLLALHPDRCRRSGKFAANSSSPLLRMASATWLTRLRTQSSD